MTLYALLCEGYDADFKQQFGSANRKTVLKTGTEVRLADIPNYFKDEQAVSDVLSYQRYQRLGFPRSNWEECDNRLVELVDCISQLDNLYHPKPQLF